MYHTREAHNADQAWFSRKRRKVEGRVARERERANRGRGSEGRSPPEKPIRIPRVKSGYLGFVFWQPPVPSFDTRIREPSVFGFLRGGGGDKNQTTMGQFQNPPRTNWFSWGNLERTGNIACDFFNLKFQYFETCNYFFKRIYKKFVKYLSSENCEINSIKIWLTKGFPTTPRIPPNSNSVFNFDFI